MKKIFNDGLYSVVEYEQKDYAGHENEYDELMKRIVASYEYDNDDYNDAQAMGELNKYNEEFFGLQENDGRFFVLYSKVGNKKSPISFAIFSKSDRPNAFHLEYICTHNDYTGSGFAELLFEQSAIALKSENCKEITSVVNNKNFASQALHNSFSKKYGVETYINDLGDASEYDFDISNMKVLKSTEEEAQAI